ncbi:Phosphoribosylamine--glycine ligase [Lentibacillus sp. JNUCC-1]|uniref:phosphoribosylamine--glycine ligase n=1 Tax=Lentibacillus sp. JNUCC-1 TaxID=2654513 RepID=UPI0012E7039E|nr:phosphoribosylamine--glycine ligase [Lentibacillus sp. JNUCC-1]MUV38589.1 Phosphoribosylamine--glycine ligase [Lentibacillus sp. JNUCC-1]
MNVLVIGKGGREHALVQKLSESPMVDELYAAPGNAGITEATCVDIVETDIDGLIALVHSKDIGMTIVGPEAPLELGIADRFHEAGLKVFAPTQKAALLEGSKSYAKAFMQRHEIPSAAYATFSDPEAAKDYIQAQGVPIVVKADGLAAGKGVVVAETTEEAIEAVDDMLVNKRFADAGATVVIEEFMEGKEFSLMAFVNGKDVYPMITARDHKRAYNQDKGPNTGGMGGYAPVPDVSAEDLTFSYEHILQKTADGLIAEGRSFTGVLYAGLMMTQEGPKVIEFNTRFGDPETQIILPLMKNDLLQVFEDVLAGKDPELEWEDQASVGVVLAANGYPEAYKKGMPIPQINGNVYTAYAGVAGTDEQLVANGGRVLLVGAKNDTAPEAAKTVYQALKQIDNNTDYFYRTDIGL